MSIGSLGLLAGNQIVLGSSSQLIAGALNVASSLISQDEITLRGGAVSVIGTTRGSPPLPGANAGTVSLVGGGSVDISGGSVLITDQQNLGSPGTIVLGDGSLNNANSGGSLSGVITLATVPEPATLLLLLPGLAFLARRPGRRERV